MPIKDYSNIFVRYDLTTESLYHLICRTVDENIPIKRVVECVIFGDVEGIKEAVNAALVVEDPVDIIYNGLIKGIHEVSRLWDEGVYYLPQTLLATDATLIGLTMCEKKLGHPVKKRGLVITHTAEGDIHDLGQKIVNALLKANGFEVIDLGKDVPAEVVIEAVIKHKPDILCGTAHLSTTMGVFKVIAERLQAEGLEIPFVCGGGGGVTASFINSFSLGVYGKDAAFAAKIAEDACRGMTWDGIRRKYNG